jgi:hypothetical protein
MAISSFANEKVAKDFLKFGFIGFSLFWCVLAFTYVYSRYALCLLLQMLFVSALDIKTRDAPTVSLIISLLSQYCKASLLFANFYVRGGANYSLCPGCPMEKRPGPACTQRNTKSHCTSNAPSTGTLTKLQNNVMIYLLLQKYTKIVPLEMEQELWHCAYWLFVKWALWREELEVPVTKERRIKHVPNLFMLRYYEMELYIMAVCDS